MENLTELKLPEVGDHILLKRKDVMKTNIEALIALVGEGKHCAISLETEKIVNNGTESINYATVAELLGHLQRYFDIYIIA